MTDREIEMSKWHHEVLRYWLRGLVRCGTPSRLGVWPEANLLWDHSRDCKTSIIEVREEAKQDKRGMH